MHDNDVAPQVVPAATNRWLKGVIVALPIAAITAFATWSLVRPVYTATAVLRLAPEENRLLFETADNSAKGPEAFAAYKRIQRQWMRSRFVIMRALHDVERLSNLPLFRDGTDPTDWLEGNLMVTFPDDSEVMHVSLSGDSPEGLHELVNAVVDAYLQEIVDVERNRKRAHLLNLEKAHDKAEAELRTKRSDFKQLVDLVGTGDSMALTIVQQNSLNQYAQFQQHFAKIRIDLMQAQNKLELHEAAAKATDAEIPITNRQMRLALRNDPMAVQLSVEKQQVLDQIQLLQESIQNGAADPKQEEFKQRLAICEERYRGRENSLRQELIEDKREAAEEEIAALKRNIALLTNQENQLHQKVRELEAEARQIGRSSIDVDMLQMEITAVKDVVASLAAEVSRTRIEMQPDSENESARATLMGKASPPGSADANFRIPATIGTGVASLLIALLVVWLNAPRDKLTS